MGVDRRALSKGPGRRYPSPASPGSRRLSTLRSIRQRLGRSPVLLHGVAGPLSLWMLASVGTRWRVEGREALVAALAEGPVILALWHEHLVPVALHWPSAAAPITNVHATTPIARIAGLAQARFGPQPVALGGAGLGATREVMGRLRNGMSVGLAVDGPAGPRGQVRDAVLDWARASGAPVWLYAAATRADRRLGTWDRLLWPRPWDRGVGLFRPWPVEIPRRLEPSQREDLRARLAAALDAAWAEARQMVQEQGTSPSR